MSSIDNNLKLKIKRKINSYVPLLYDELNYTVPTFIDVLKKCELNKTINRALRLYCYECYKIACTNNEIESLPYEDEKILRYYQENGLNNIKQNLNNDGRTLCHMPTGAGKTVLAYSVMSNNITNDLQLFCIISPLIRLNNQNIKRKYLNILHNNNYNKSNNIKKFKTIEVNCKNKNWTIEHEKYKGKYNIIFSITYASFHLVDKYLQDNNIICNMLIADECHTIPAKVNIKDYYDLDNNVEYKKMNDTQKQRVRGWKSLFLNNITYKKRLFLTATPYTYQETKIEGYYNSTELYGKVVKPVTIKELIEQGYLASIIPYEAYIESRENNERFNTDVAESVMKFSIDYNRTRVCIYVNRKENGNNLIKAIKANKLFKEMTSTKTVEIYGYFDSCNNNEYIDFSEHENLTKDEQILEAFGQNETTDNFDNNKLKIIVSVRKLTMGIDVPCIDTIVFADPKLSKSDFAQAVGRGLRPFTYSSGMLKECCLLLINNNEPSFRKMIQEFINYAIEDVGFEINQKPRKTTNRKGIHNSITPASYGGKLEFDIKIMEEYKAKYQGKKVVKSINDFITILKFNKITNPTEYNYEVSNKLFTYDIPTDSSNIFNRYTNFGWILIQSEEVKSKYYSSIQECNKAIENLYLQLYNDKGDELEYYSQYELYEEYKKIDNMLPDIYYKEYYAK